MNWKSIIREFLQKEDPKVFATHLRTHWIHFTKNEKLEVFQFLVVAGQKQNFLILFAKELSEAKPALPWEHFFTIVRQSATKVPPAHRQLLVQIFKGKKVPLPENPGWDDFVKGIQVRKKELFEQKLKKIKEELEASARIAEGERLHDQHMNYLKQLKRIFPSDTTIGKDLHFRQRTFAEDALQKPRSYQSKNTPSTPREDPEMQRLATDWMTQALSFEGMDDQTQLDLAIMFEQMDFSRLALNFLPSENLGDRSAWFLFDFLLSAKQYLSLLNHCEVMKIRFAEDPEALFSISYFEAQTYWALGEQEQAVDLMKHISSLKPHFRSAGELLAGWLEEVN